MHSGPTSEVQYRPLTFDCTVRQQHGAGIMRGGERKGRRARRRVRRFYCVTLKKMVRFLVDAIFQRDYPVVLDVHMLMALVMLLGNLLVDVLYLSLNLHVRYQSAVGLMARGAIARKGFV
jgi:hypothetical protein